MAAKAKKAKTSKTGGPKKTVKNGGRPDFIVVTMTTDLKKAIKAKAGDKPLAQVGRELYEAWVNRGVKKAPAATATEDKTTVVAVAEDKTTVAPAATPTPVVAPAATPDAAAATA